MQRFLCLAVLIGLAHLLPAQTLPAQIYAWQSAAVSKKANSKQRVLLEGSTRDFKHLKIHATTLPPHQAPHPAHRHADEELLIVKEGSLTVTIEDKTATLGPGSVALMLPGDSHGFENKGDSSATYFVMRYESSTPADSARGRRAGGSFWIDYRELAFQGHAKGGIRRFFDRPTVLTSRFEMHVSTLKPGLWSHPPHTHRAAEILLLIDGEAQESIDGTLYPARVGDIIFLESNVPHAIQNTGTRPCTYFAFQFE